jgi:hypothetical protein
MTSPEVAALLARDESRAREKAPLWSSHELSSMKGVEIFSEAQRVILNDLPEVFLLRAEPDFDELRLLLRSLTDTVRNIGELQSTRAVEDFFVALLRRGRDSSAAAFSLDRLRFLEQQKVALLYLPSLRPQALFELGLFALSLMPAHAKHTSRLDRLYVAAVAIQPGSIQQVRRWMTRPPANASTGDLAEHEIPLRTASHIPVRLGGPSLF